MNKLAVIPPGTIRYNGGSDRWEIYQEGLFGLCYWTPCPPELIPILESTGMRAGTPAELVDGGEAPMLAPDDPVPATVRPVPVDTATVPGAYRDARDNPPGTGNYPPYNYETAFHPDGYQYPRPQDEKFDIFFRDTAILPNATQETNLPIRFPGSKGGWVRWVGWGFNDPNGEMLVRTTLLFQGASSRGYMWATIDTALGSWSGSFPPVIAGTIEDPTEVWIPFPPATTVFSVRFQNTSLLTTFIGSVRVKGWAIAD